MANTNCLEGIKCPNPECGQDETFDIQATVWATVFDDGVESGQNYEWDDESKIVCRECGKVGAVIDFKKGAGVEAITDRDEALADDLRLIRKFNDDDEEG